MKLYHDWWRKSSPLDYCGFNEFENTIVALLVISGGPFPTPALVHLRSVCRALNAWVFPYQAAVPRIRTAFDADGFTDDVLHERVRTLGKRIVQFAHVEPTSFRTMMRQEV